MTSRYQDMEHMVQRYVHDKLSAKEAEEFEAFFISQPDVIEMVETAQNIKIGMAHAKLQASEDAYSKVHTGSASEESLIEKLKSWISIPVPAYAVAALALVMLGAPQFTWYASNDSLPTNSGIEMARFSTAVTRSAAKPIEIDFDRFEKDVGVFLKLKSVDYPYYQLSLRENEATQAAWQSEPFQPSALRDYLVVVPREIKGSLQLSLQGIDEQGAKTEVSFCNYSEVCY